MDPPLLTGTEGYQVDLSHGDRNGKKSITEKSGGDTFPGTVVFVIFVLFSSLPPRLSVTVFRYTLPQSLSVVFIQIVYLFITLTLSTFLKPAFKPVFEGKSCFSDTRLLALS